MVSPPSSALTEAARPTEQSPGWDLAISKQGDDLALSWSDRGPGVTYEVWAGTTAHLQPGDAGAQLLADALPSPAFVDLTATDDASRYYRVRVSGDPNDVSTIVGKVTTELQPGFTKIGLCLLSELDTAEELFSDSPTPMLSVHRWDAVSQDWAWSWADAPVPLSFETGDAIAVNHDATLPVEPNTYTHIGHVPVGGDVRLELQPGDNLVTTLPTRADLETASELLAAVDHATRIGRPDPTTHTIEWYPDGPDFDLDPCMPIHVEVDELSTWPPTRVRRIVGPAGATIEAYDGAVVLDIPPGALTEPVEIQLSPHARPIGGATTPTLAFEPHDIDFAVPVSLTSRYRPAGTAPGPHDAAATMVRLSTDGSTTVLDATNDVAAGTLTASLETFSWIDTGMPCDASNPVAMTLSPDSPSTRVGELDNLVLTATLVDINGDPVVPAWAGTVTWDPIALDPVALVTPQANTTEAAIDPIAPGSTTVTATTPACRIVYDPVADAFDQVTTWPVTVATSVVVPSCGDRIAQGECPSDGCTIACTAGACDGTTPTNDGGPCQDDANPCSTDVCLGGVCNHFPVDCNDGNECTFDICDPAVGCLNPPDPCDDGLTCTLDLCDPAIGCTNPPLSCPDQDACHNGSCSEPGGCQQVPIACSGGNTCGALACDPQAGCQLQPFAPGTFCGDDGNPCTADICDGAGSCQHPITIECAIGLCFFFGQCQL